MRQLDDDPILPDEIIKGGQGRTASEMLETVDLIAITVGIAVVALAAAVACYLLG